MPDFCSESGSFLSSSGTVPAVSAAGSGTSVQDVNQLIRQFDQAKQMMKQMTNLKGKGKMRFKMPGGFGM